MTELESLRAMIEMLQKHILVVEKENKISKEKIKNLEYLLKEEHARCENIPAD
jgi:peptidoglycan hydrolase CwlO-like protein